MDNHKSTGEKLGKTEINTKKKWIGSCFEMKFHPGLFFSWYL